MLAPTARKAGQRIYSNVRLCRSLAQRGSNDPAQSSMICDRIVKVLGEFYVSTDDMGASEIPPDAVLTVDDNEPAEVAADFLHIAMDKLDSSLTDEQKLSVLKIAGGIKSRAMISALKNPPTKNMTLFFSLDSKSTNLASAKFSIPERLKMLNSIVPSLSFILH